ncbi:MAG: TraR/DksA family transcriptional regulator [Gammaproteobacteria bacterium]
MDDDTLEQLRRQLLRLKTELEAMEETSSEATRPVELDQASVGRLSRMDAMRAQHMALEVGRRREVQLSRIEGAFRRMAAGDYGSCYVCGEDIDAARLLADPTITRCIRCAE